MESKILADSPNIIYPILFHIFKRMIQSKIWSILFENDILLMQTNLMYW
jgi:hypothetical protein